MGVHASRFNKAKIEIKFSADKSHPQIVCNED